MARKKTTKKVAKKVAKKIAHKTAKKTTRKKTAARKTTPKAKAPAKGASGPGGESALTCQGPSWWKPGMPVDPGFRRRVEEDPPTRSSSPSIPVGIYPPERPAPEETPAPEPAATRRQASTTPISATSAAIAPTPEPAFERDSDYLPAEVVTLDSDLTADVEELLNGDFEAIDALLDGPVDDLLSDIAADAPEEFPEELVEEFADEFIEDLAEGFAEESVEHNVDDLTEATDDPLAELPFEAETFLEIPQDVLDTVDQEMPLGDDPALVDPGDFVRVAEGDDEPAPGPAADEEFQPVPVDDAPPAEEPPAPVDEPPPPAEEPPPPVEEPPPPVVEPVRKRVGASDAENGRRAEPEPDPAPARQPLIVTVLQGLNYPLRALPPSSRVIVDWVAWSLIFWVPVVWVITILVVGR